MVTGIPRVDLRRIGQMKWTDLSVLVGIILIVFMMIIPLPPWLLDILIFINIALALTIILVAMNTQKPLEFSIFPSLLLVTTLFRLALNISTTRSILANREAGRIIDTFGSFVVGGSPVIGFVVFLILVIIQFIVITKGAERVAEVSARFTLDAMPGKQMSIDADLNAGIITDREARERRELIEREADFYGAMDGASKFVKGDAIASIIILIVNILGGLVIGMVVHGMPLGEAASLFTLLTIGDGLVTQIPALLISTAAGIVVTRAASDSNLGSDITKQLTAYPKMLYVVAAIIGLLGLLTPIGPVRALPLAALIGLGAYYLQKAEEKEQQTEEDLQEKEAIEEVRSPESVMSLLTVDPIEFEFGYALIPLADVNQGGDILDRVIMIRRQLALEMGMVVPVIRIRDNIQLEPNEYVIKIKGNEVARYTLMVDHYLAMNPGIEDESVTGIPTTEPAFGLPALWITEAMRETAEQAGYTVVDPPSVVATHLTEVIKRHMHELLGRQETKSLVDFVKESAPALVEELVPDKLAIGEIQKVLQNLLREKVSIRDLHTILEALADASQLTKDPNVLTEYVRQALSRQITRMYAGDEQVVKAVTLSPEAEKEVADHIQQTEQGSYLAMEPNLSQQFYQKVAEQVKRFSDLGEQVVLLTSPALRMYIRQLIERAIPDLPVLSYNELEPQVEVKNVGVVNIR